jgi:hypothetical protein
MLRRKGLVKVAAPPPWSPSLTNLNSFYATVQPKAKTSCHDHYHIHLGLVSCQQTIKQWST